MKTVKSLILRELYSHPRWQWRFARMASVSRALRKDPVSLTNHNDNAPFMFIVGCGRSGNTLLRRLLVEQCEIYIPPESYVIPQQISDFWVMRKQGWDSFVDLALARLEYHPEFDTFGVDSLSPFAIQAKSWSSDFHTIYDLLFGLYRWLSLKVGVSCSWLGDKTPLNTLHLGKIYAAFPSATYIFIERDPIDVVASYVDAGLYETHEEAAQRWVVSAKAWGRFFSLAKKSANLISVRYEDLVYQPNVTIEGISSKIDLPMRFNEVSLDGLRLGDVGSRAHHRKVLTAPSIESIGKGRQKLGSNELKRIRGVVGDMPVRRGYAAV